VTAEHQDHGEHGGHGKHGGHDEHQGHGGHGGHDHAAMIADFRRRFWVSTVLTLPILALSPMIRGWLGVTDLLAFRGDAWLQAALATVVFFYGGWPFLAGLVSEVRRRQPGMMTLIGVATGVAWGYSTAVAVGLPGKVFFWELATLVDVMLLGHWIEMRSVLGASRALEKLVQLLPDTAHRLRADGSLEEVPASQLAAGDHVVVKPGERVPTDGRIVDGRTSLDQSLLTGESKPVEKGEGDEVIGGAVNGEAAIEMEVERTGDDTYLSQVVELVRRSQESRSRTQDLAQRAAGWLTWLALSAGFVTLAAWLFLGRDFAYALERMVTVMVITCPHALGLAVPLVVAVSTAMSASHGLLLRDRSAFERARLLTAVIFDKTGTLTEGRFGVSDVVLLAADGEATDGLASQLDETAALRLAAAVESRSEHPIAAGVLRAAEERGLDVPPAKDFRAIPGKGAEATVEGRLLRVVSPGYLDEHGLAVDDDAVREMAAKGRTVVYLLAASDGAERPLAALGLADRVRAESRQALDRLREMGIRRLMLTGDAEAVARQVAEELDLDEYFAEVLPDEKSARVRQVREGGDVVAMTGDGVNDAPALVEADVGIAIGAGTDVAVESADVVLVRSDPRDVVSIVQLARATYRKMVQNLWWASGYNLLAIPLAAGILQPWGIVLSPAAGAALMSLSTVIVAVNARLLGRSQLRDESQQCNADAPRGRDDERSNG
jgi:Cu2+-exporting ATPase